jgi:hypothetical protein
VCKKKDDDGQKTMSKSCEGLLKEFARCLLDSDCVKVRPLGSLGSYYVLIVACYQLSALGASMLSAGHALQHHYSIAVHSLTVLLIAGRLVFVFSVDQS